MSGRLSVSKTEDGRLQMNFPQYSVYSIKSTFGNFEEFETVITNFKLILLEVFSWMTLNWCP
jgi:hypothetical protein